MIPLLEGEGPLELEVGLSLTEIDLDRCKHYILGSILCYGTEFQFRHWTGDELPHRNESFLGIADFMGIGFAAKFYSGFEIDAQANEQIVLDLDLMGI